MNEEDQKKNITRFFDPSLYDSIKEFSRKRIHEIAEELVSVQPMPSNLFIDMMKEGKSEQWNG
jgi:hypothetical protein